MDDLSIGARIKTLRRRPQTRMTQRDLAEKAGVSIDLVQKLEQKARHTASLRSLRAIADALDITVGELVGKKTALPESRADEGVVAIRHAIADADDLIPGLEVEEQALTLADAQHSVDYLWGAYWAGRFQLVGQLLPTTLPQLRATVRAVPISDRSTACEALARGYQVAGDTLVHMGQQDAAWSAIRHAITAARDGDDELLDAALRVSVAWQLLVQGRWEESERVAVRAAETTEPVGDVSLEQVATHGVLAVTAATASARAGKADTTTGLLGVAREMSARVGSRDRSVCQTTFGPSKVAMLEVDCCVVQERFVEALDAAKQLPREAVLPKATRARHLADVAYSQMRLGRDGDSVETLLAMATYAPDWLPFQTLPRVTTAELLERHRRVGEPLRRLARLVGVE